MGRWGDGRVFINPDAHVLSYTDSMRTSGRGTQARVFGKVLQET